ncbi:MAG: hypothetical protein Q8P67_15240 [archaeon]|nr:hypothetical protein [archaeon]
MTGHWFHPDGATERWAHWRENTHKQFQFNKRNIPLLAVAVVAVPYLIYVAARNDQIVNDEPKRRGVRDYC